MTMKDGGPAFPHPAGWRRDPEISDGMSLRDYFAAAALTASYINGFAMSPDRRAEMAYEQADAMLTERAKKAGAL